MNILAFDMATNACTIALQVGDAIFARHKVAPREHASLILSDIQSLCDEAHFDLLDVDAIAFGCGPGSFMGVRLATAVAQGLAFGLKKPLISISTLQILAQTVFRKTAEKKILAGWDARINEIYWGFYEVDAPGIAQSVLEDRLCAAANINALLLPEKNYVLAGNAWEVYRAQLSQGLQAVEKQFTHFYPEATAMLAIAQAKYFDNEMVSAIDAQPHYIRHHVVHHSK